MGCLCCLGTCVLIGKKLLFKNLNWARSLFILCKVKAANSLPNSVYFIIYIPYICRSHCACNIPLSIYGIQSNLHVWNFPTRTIIKSATLPPYRRSVQNKRAYSSIRNYAQIAWIHSLNFSPKKYSKIYRINGCWPQCLVHCATCLALAHT